VTPEQVTLRRVKWRFALMLHRRYAPFDDGREP
jgi:hypothetical protein